MAISYEIDQERDVVLAHAEGALDLSDTLAHVAEVFGDERFRPGMHAVFDMSQATLASFQANDVHRLLGALETKPQSLGPGARWAIVAASELDFGVSRMFEMLAETLPIEVRVFSERAEAEAWVGAETANEGG